SSSRRRKPCPRDPHRSPRPPAAAAAPGLVDRLPAVPPCGPVRHTRSSRAASQMKEPTMTSDNGLRINVHVAPMRPVPDPDAQQAGIRPMWSPCSSTLITSETGALLVDTLITYDQVDVLADWIKGFGKRLVGVLLTHGHSD